MIHFVNSIFNSISYRISDTIIDPGDEWEGFEDVEAVLLTHAHFDHIYGLNRLLELNPEAKVYTNEAGKEMLLNAKKNLSFYHATPFMFRHPEKIVTVSDGDEVELGENVIAKAVFTPGHNPSCITWIVCDNLFTGDAYIPGVKTVTNLPTSNKKDTLDSEQLIIELAQGRTIRPGHKV